MSMLDLKTIQGRCEAATPGPWTNSRKIFDLRECRDADEEFIAHARQDVPALVEELDMTRWILARLLKRVAQQENSGKLFDMQSLLWWQDYCDHLPNDEKEHFDYRVEVKKAVAAYYGVEPWII